jgi:hypothetical protein
MVIFMTTISDKTAGDNIASADFMLVVDKLQNGADTGVNLGALKTASGSNKWIGTGAFSNSTACTVTNTNVTANSAIFVFPTSAPVGTKTWYISARNVGVSFVVTSDGTETSTTFVYIIVEPTAAT